MNTTSFSQNVESITIRSLAMLLENSDLSKCGSADKNLTNASSNTYEYNDENDVI